MIPYKFEYKVGYTPTVYKLSCGFYNSFVIEKISFLTLNTLGDKLKSKDELFDLLCHM